MQSYIERFLADLKNRKRYADNTIAAYRNDLHQFMDYVTQSQISDWSSMNKQDLVGFQLYLRGAHKEYAASTLARKLACVRSFCHYLASSGLLAQDPAEGLDSPHVERPTPRTLTSDEVSQLLQLPGTSQSSKGRRDRAILELLYATGMRVSELTALDVSDVNLSTGTVRCGGRTSQRTLSLGYNATQALRDYLEQARAQMINSPEQKALFVNHRGERLSRQGLWLVIKGYVKHLGLDESITPHTLRHSAAAHRLSGGAHLAEVQRLLGHASPTSTQVYARLARAAKAEDSDPTYAAH